LPNSASSSSAAAVDVTSPAETAARRWPVRFSLFGVIFALVIPGLESAALLLARIANAEPAGS